MRSRAVWHRIRWANVTRLGALVALALLVAAWPRLGSPPPHAPDAAPVPLVGGKAPPPRAGKREAGRAKREGAERPQPRARRAMRARAERERTGRKRAQPRGRRVTRARAERARAPRERAPRARPERAHQVHRPPRAAPAPDPAAAEFGLP